MKPATSKKLAGALIVILPVVFLVARSGKDRSDADRSTVVTRGPDKTVEPHRPSKIQPKGTGNLGTETNAGAITVAQKPEHVDKAEQRANRAQFAEAVSNGNPSVTSLLKEMHRSERKRASTLEQTTLPVHGNIIVSLLVERATPEQLERIKNLERSAAEVNGERPGIGAAASNFTDEYAQLNSVDRVISINIPRDPKKRVAIQQIGLESSDQLQREGGIWKGMGGPVLTAQSLTLEEFTDAYSHLVELSETEESGDS